VNVSVIFMNPSHMTSSGIHRGQAQMRVSPAT